MRIRDAFGGQDTSQPLYLILPEIEGPEDGVGLLCQERVPSFQNSTGISMQALSTGARPNAERNHRANSDILRRFRIRKTSLPTKPE